MPDVSRIGLRLSLQAPGSRLPAHTRSNTIAYPIPPCAQIEISPNCTSRRRISFARRVTRRAPGERNGWWRGMEPRGGVVAGGGDGGAESKGAAGGVGALPVDLAPRSGESEPVGPRLGSPRLDV